MNAEHDFIPREHAVMMINNNENRSNLVKSRIAVRFYSLGGNSNVQLHVLSGGSTQIFPGGSGTPCNAI